MTNKEHLIDLLTENCPGNVDRKTVEVCFEIFNKRDWAIFCSQMGDYDHPGERINAEKVFEEEQQEFAHPFGVLEHRLLEVIDHVRIGLLYNSKNSSRFYRDNFHKLNEEYRGEK